VRCDAGSVPYIGRMEHGTRFELRLPAGRRRELAALADETGLSAADLVRLGIRWLLDHPGVLLKPEGQNSELGTGGA
jgi:hypothetical protein